ncbi:MAG: FG-GAP-like repeat-containing protein, partial [Planctomycetota bacterium]
MRAFVGGWTWVLAALSLAVVGTAGEPEYPDHVLYTLVGDEPFDDLGLSIVPLGEVDGDGVPDFAVAEPGGNLDPGRVQFVSGASGAIIRTLDAPEDVLSYAQQMGGHGDLDGDGVLDVAISAILRGSADHFFDVRSGATGERLLTVPISTTDITRIRIVDDLDRDGHTDLIVGQGYDRNLPFHLRRQYSKLGFVAAYTRDGKLLWRTRGKREYDLFGQSFCQIYDRTGDGVPDIATTAPLRETAFRENLVEPEPIYFLDGATGAIYDRVELYTQPIKFGYTIESLGDFNGDGFDEIVLGSPMAPNHGYPGAGMVSVLDGATWVPLWETRGQDYNRWYVGSAMYGDRLGIRLTVTPDFDGDGAFDVLVGTERGGFIGLDSRRVYWYSGRTGDLLAGIENDVNDSAFGQGVASVGDLNNDGVPDLLIGAPGHRPRDARTNPDHFPHGALYAVRVPQDRPRFIRGDANADGRVTLSDCIAILNYLFAGGESSCVEAMDLDRSNEVRGNDAVYLALCLFR